jgi:hypothetical protein
MIDQKHQLIFRKCDDVQGFLQNSPIRMKTMGRGLQQESEFFMTAGLAGKLAIELLTGHLCMLGR